MSEHNEAQFSEKENHATEAGNGTSEKKPGRTLVFWFVIGFIASLIVGWVLFPPLLYSKKVQPFDFNHVAHVEGAGMDCDECHRYDGNGRFSGAPSFQFCLDCHTWSGRQNEDNEAETEFLKQFVNEDDELIGDPKWLIYTAQPDCVYFSHIAHTEKAGFKCEECHGDHGKTTGLSPMYINRLTRYPLFVEQNMKMNDCGDCHTKYDKPENNACFVCHK